MRWLCYMARRRMSLPKSRTCLDAILPQLRRVHPQFAGHVDLGVRQGWLTRASIPACNFGLGFLVLCHLRDRGPFA
jgi:hypothetical protein